MIYFRQPTSTPGTGETWISVLLDGLPEPAPNYYEIAVYCLNEYFIFSGLQAGNTSGGGGVSGNYRTPTLTFGNLFPGAKYNFYATIKRTEGSPEEIVPANGYFSVTTISSRPSSFSWAYPKTTGNDATIFAFEWNAFFNKINEFRQYKNIGSYSYTAAYTGLDFYAYIFNEAVIAISAMSPSIPTPSPVATNDAISAYHLNQLVLSLNSIN